jgi:hypothetical protein
LRLTGSRIREIPPFNQGYDRMVKTSRKEMEDKTAQKNPRATGSAVARGSGGTIRP